MKWLLLALLMPVSAHATIYIFTQCQPAKVISRTASGYTVSDMASGNTQVMDLGGMTAIFGGGRPTSFIMDGGEVGRSMEGAVPALDPGTGGVNPVLPLPVEFQ